MHTCDSATGECTTEPYPPPAVTQTERFPICPAELGDDCFTDSEFMESCYDNPGECEWDESTYVEEPTIDLKLGGRIYES